MGARPWGPLFTSTGWASDRDAEGPSKQAPTAAYGAETGWGRPDLGLESCHGGLLTGVKESNLDFTTIKAGRVRKCQAWVTRKTVVSLTQSENIKTRFHMEHDKLGFRWVDFESNCFVQESVGNIKLKVCSLIQSYRYALRNLGQALKAAPALLQRDLQSKGSFNTQSWLSKWWMLQERKQSGMKLPDTEAAGQRYSHRCSAVTSAILLCYLYFLSGSMVKSPPAKAGDAGWIHGSGRFPGGYGNPL